MAPHFNFTTTQEIIPSPLGKKVSEGRMRGDSAKMAEGWLCLGMLQPPHPSPSPMPGRGAKRTRDFKGLAGGTARRRIRYSQGQVERNG